MPPWSREFGRLVPASALDRSLGLRRMGAGSRAASVECNLPWSRTRSRNTSTIAIGDALGAEASGTGCHVRYCGLRPLGVDRATSM